MLSDDNNASSSILLIFDEVQGLREDMIIPPLPLKVAFHPEYGSQQKYRWIRK